MHAAINQQHAKQALAQMAEIEARTLRHVAELADAERSWHLVQIGHSSFELAKVQLKRAGYTLYAPLMRTMVIPRSNQLSRSSRKNRHLLAKEKLAPFFGNYRFVRFDASVDPWHDIFKLAGVYGIACANAMPVPMPDAIVDELKGKEINGAIPGSTPVKALNFKVGDAARINEGPFVGFEGTIERIDEGGRIRLLLALFATLTPVELTADEIDKITK